MPENDQRSISFWAGTVLVGLALLAPFGVNEYYQSFLLQVFLVIALAQAWNLISGMTGYVSFGHAAFFGVGAYTGALFLTWGYPWWIAIFNGAGIAALIAVPLGFLTLRLRGPYFAIAMLGLNEVGRIVATLWVSVTKGGTGLPLPPSLLPSLDITYFMMLSLALGATLLIAWVHRSRFGLELRAIREDEEAAEMVGVNTTRNKVTAFVLSALIPGAVGAVYAMYTSYINPASAFDPARNIEMIVVVLFGGSGTVWGPIIGAATVMFLREMLWAQFPAAHLAALGVLLLIVVLYLPGGLVSIVRERHRERPDARPGESP
ncbi:MAG: branched-chain amino acid ABC transporter permease [Gammaproteobacteria bacterium]|nr:branched-chain amino acid ABC transporter permease [Gammaproteobacteria bacterium]MDH3370321.1 branched-chain amino acid ABC transporter permease [Gammaproteobacteria bacterium]MDH3407180.1 branched-chain amino acid ABC transporter permease [Gammaproteobacteria bacterium]MDH3562892.1 branched-chain amino acid ABC transporter permease [Gammaproteobacteria bacterium]MDH5487735.1 branched-chain amino acid ABC transporter permease [Gammaproteobacteria bacterium]